MSFVVFTDSGGMLALFFLVRGGWNDPLGRFAPDKSVPLFLKKQSQLQSKKIVFIGQLRSSPCGSLIELDLVTSLLDFVGFGQKYEFRANFFWGGQLRIHPQSCLNLILRWKVYREIVQTG